MPEIISVSFDRFPSPKGAATHIDAFARALGAEFGAVDLVTVEPLPDDQPGSNEAERQQGGVEWAPGVRHVPLPAEGGNLIERVLSFRRQLDQFWKGRSPAVAHVRSIFEGYPLAREKEKRCGALVFEVNGMPSVELKYHYPQVADDEEFLRKLRHQEDVCLREADLIITVSQMTSRYLKGRGADPRKIEVIPNGVDLECFSYCSPRKRDPGSPFRLLYAGTMTAWQGVHHALEALALLRRDHPATLQLVGHARPSQEKWLRQEAAVLGVAGAVEWVPPVSKPVLVKYLHGCDAFLAPLARNDRNGLQGCCPLKILEAMAAGPPVIASDLEVVRHLIDEECEEGMLARPGSGKAIKDCVLRLLDEEGLGVRLSRQARRRVERDFPWERAQESLIQAYGTKLRMP
ncbi:MAG: glycosyltransferase family 4 protein [Verrucomicrobiota bacterium]